MLGVVHNVTSATRLFDVLPLQRWLADTLPEIASQWHPSLNGKLTPQTVVWDSKRTVWWRTDCCSHEWQESVRDRDKYTTRAQR